MEEMICLETTIPCLFYLDDAMSSQRRGTQGRYAAMRTQSARLEAQIEVKIAIFEMATDRKSKP